jgi:hypothetical protein
MLDPPPYTPSAVPPYSATDSEASALSARLQRASAAAAAVQRRPHLFPYNPSVPGLPRVSGSVPCLNHFHVASYSSLNNPNTRIYNNIVQRRMARDYESAVSSILPAVAGCGTIDVGLLARQFPTHTLMTRLGENASFEANCLGEPVTAASAAAEAAAAATDDAQQPDHAPEEPVRPLEDPNLVGEEAAERARTARLERERRMQDVLVAEDQHWDQFLCKLRQKQVRASLASQTAMLTISRAAQVNRDRNGPERSSPIVVSPLLSGAPRSPQSQQRQRRGGLMRRLGTLGRFMSPGDRHYL